MADKLKQMHLSHVMVIEMGRLSAVIAVLILVALCGTAAEAYVIQPEELEEIIKNIETYPNLVIIDVRKAEDYANGHIPGAINIYWKSFRDEKGVLLPVCLLYTSDAADE